MHTHRIICEICDKITTHGIITKDNGLRDRYFCSEECLDKLLRKQAREKQKMEKPLWRKVFGKSHLFYNQKDKKCQQK